jgi:peptide deformylase
MFLEHMTLTPLDKQDPRLRQVCAKLTRPQLRTKQQQLEIDALLDFVYGRVNKNARGMRRDPKRPTTVGLAGNQVGIMKQICVVDLSIGHQGYSDMHVLVNPRVTWCSKSILIKPEGCVNFADIWGLTHRSRIVKVEAWDRSGNEVSFRLQGWPAALLQHEIDHLYGRLFIDRLPDPSKAHMVPKEKYAEYKKVKPDNWTDYADVSKYAVTLPDSYQPGMGD